MLSSYFRFGLLFCVNHLEKSPFFSFNVKHVIRKLLWLHLRADKCAPYNRAWCVGTELLVWHTNHWILWFSFVACFMFNQNGTFETVGNSSFPFFDYDFIRSFLVSFTFFFFFIPLFFCTLSSLIHAYRFELHLRLFFFFPVSRFSIRDVVQLDAFIIAKLFEFTLTKYPHIPQMRNSFGTQLCLRQSEIFPFIFDFVGRFAC